jgi:hypothetical protein
MKHQYSLGDSVILRGVVDGLRFNDDIATIVALRLHDPEYQYLIKVHNRKDGRFHEGHLDKSEVEYIKSEFRDNGFSMIKSNSGEDRYNIPERVIKGLNVKDYDPTQQPYDEEDI